MQKSSEIYLLFSHMEWADAIVWKSVLEHSPVCSDAKIRGLLYHIHNVQRAFFYLWTNAPLNFPKETDFKDIREIANYGFENYPNLFTYLNSIEAEELKMIIEIPWSKRLDSFFGKKVGNPTLVETILQVTSHSIYHRGQVNKRLREIGAEPQLVDFIAWIWYGKPEADWSSLSNSPTDHGKM